MTEQNKGKEMTPEIKEEKLKIYAYGFDKAKFNIPTKTVTFGDRGIIEFVKFEDTKSLDEADGVIIPQGIFEEIKYHRSEYSFYGWNTSLKVYQAVLLERERQAINLLKDNRWICFLVDAIVDEIPRGDTNKYIKDTDLCKRFLNEYQVYRRTDDGLTHLEVKTNEFQEYITKYGVAKTVFTGIYDHDRDKRIITTSKGNIVGFEIHNKIFFLPYHTTQQDPTTIESIAKMVVKSITDYRQRRMVSVPAWTDEFQFKSEIKLKAEYEELLKGIEQKKNEYELWKSNKIILSTADDILKDKVINILEQFWGMKVDPIDRYREDSKIISETGETLVMVEIKGTKRGVQREYINQVDSHRERNGLTTKTPGALIINNEMSIENIDERLGTKVPEDQIKHAKNLNILTIRTIDMLYLMKHFEDNPNRKEELLGLFSSGGGWLKADPEKFEIITIS